MTTFVNTDILTYLCDLCDLWTPPAGEPTGLGAALWRMGSHSARGRTIGRPFGKLLPILPVSRSPLGEMEEDPPTFQQVSMYVWALAAGSAQETGEYAWGGCWGRRLATDGSLGRGVSLLCSLLGLEAECGECPLCEIK